MSKSKIPDSDSNIIQSLDDDQSISEETKLELQHIYYEPKKMCDVQIIYNNIALHLHTVTLAQNSVYFLNLFEEKDMNKSPIDYSIDARTVQYFFDRIYTYEQFTYKDLMPTVPISLFSSLIYLSHYFQVERLENNFRDIAAKFVENRDATRSKNFAWTLALICQRIQWNDIETGLIEWIGTDLEQFMNIDYKPHWLNLNSKARQEIYLAALEQGDDESWGEIAKEVSETIAETSSITKFLPSQEWEIAFKDTIAEAILFAAVKQRKVLLP